MRAIELNGVAVESNKRAFHWGRRAAVDLAAVERAARPPAPIAPRTLSQTLDETVARRVEFLTAYQNAAYAKRYSDLVGKVPRRAEAARAGGQSGFAEAVARYPFKLMAYKDEYEVARLYTDGTFLNAVRRAVRGRLHARIPPRAAADRRARSGNRPSEEAQVRAVDADGVPLPRRLEGPARHGARPRSAARAERRMERQLIADYLAPDRGDRRDPHAGQPPHRRGSSPRFPSTSAATATSRRRISSPRRRARRSCSRSTARPRRRRWHRRRSSCWRFSCKGRFPIRPCAAFQQFVRNGKFEGRPGQRDQPVKQLINRTIPADLAVLNLSRRGQE